MPEIDWNDYVIEREFDTGYRYIHHDVPGCPATSESGLYSLQEFIDWALAHHDTYNH